jgi:restriction system protein
VRGSSVRGSGRVSLYAEKIARRIVLIDGRQLAQLMLNYNVEVRIEEALYIKNIDEGFFISQ